ncbi:hypothetical protein [Streptomyces sp. NPDC049590]|uniref:hypothetical protein n=1 Tax=Streptomyces sp. NPDC049590 TaxID=3154834 RepID=UPI00343CAEAB
MDFLRPASREEALAATAGHTAAVPIAGGTGAMAGTGFDRRRPGPPPGPHRAGDLGAGTRSLRAEPSGPAPAPHPVASPRIRGRGAAGGLGTVRPGAGARPAPHAAGPEAKRATAARGTRRWRAGAARGTRKLLAGPGRTGVGRDALRPGGPAPTILGAPPVPAGALPPADRLALYGPRGAGGATAPSSASAGPAAVRDATAPGPGRTPARPGHPAGRTG